ncbi:hypothetical protein CDL10_11250 [Avrilella dinanensis]|uniref:Uncharacterized protein n=2 Tax=Avrilella dinanensis TaxID=2008672 RepID=A0A2M9R2F7_9FLAO|nr:hypothetical protein CDL10_11250 [Avrilella dinanensis]
MFTLISCKSQQTAEDKELYVSGYMNEARNIPFKSFIYVHKDSVFMLNKDLQIEFSFSTNEIISNNFQQRCIKNGNKFSLIQTNTETGQITDFHYFKTQPNELSKASFTEKFLNKTFSTEIPKTLSSPNSDFDIVKNVVFLKDSVNISYEYYYDDIKIYAEKESLPVNYIEIDNRLFVNENSESNFSRFYQIIPKGNDFELLSYGETLPVIEKYQAKSETNTSDYSTYSTCLDSRPGEYYFNNDVGYAKGNQYLLRQIQQNAPESGSDNGYITVHFTINCHQNVGRFGLEQMNRKYQPAQFDAELIQYLVNFIAQLDEWENADKIDSGMYRDVHAFYMFKIENGKITDICP